MTSFLVLVEELEGKNGAVKQHLHWKCLVDPSLHPFPAGIHLD